MGRNSNKLWDDSTLIDAFDHAVSKYKKMHGKARGANLSIADDLSNAEENSSHSVEKTEEESAEPSEMNALPASMAETSILGCVSESLNVTSHVEESCPDGELSLDHMADSSENKKTSADSVCGNETYNELISEYYKIENQRQTLLHRLHHASYLYSDPCYTNATYPMLQGDASVVSGSHNGYQGYYPDHLLPSCSYSYGFHTSHAPPNMFLPYSHVHQEPEAMENNQLNGKVDGNPTQAVTKDVKILSSMRFEPCPASNPQDNERKSETRATCESLCLPGGSETDLSVVLSAWYTAGFHTGRYLLEQSLKKDQHGHL